VIGIVWLQAALAAQVALHLDTEQIREGQTVRLDLQVVDATPTAVPKLEVAAEDSQRIQRSAHHLLGLISEILDHARLETGKTELKPAPTAREKACVTIAAHCSSALRGIRRLSWLRKLRNTGGVGMADWSEASRRAMLGKSPMALGRAWAKRKL
jgi:signal transduction histidine kinase